MFRFTQDCIIGVDELDNEHKYLFDLIHTGIDMLHDDYVMDRYEDIKELVAKLEDYADQHFNHEEEYMEQIRDPELIRQRAQHMAFRDKIRSFSFADIDDLDEQQRVLTEIMNYLAKWLYRHIIGSDILIGKLPPLEEWMLRENPCEFTDEYRTGIDLIDREHEELFRIVAKANKVVRSGSDECKVSDIKEILDELIKYTVQHFADEEEYMESIHYEGLESQRRAHVTFIDKIAEFSELELEQDPQEYLEGLIMYLLGWLVNHILNADKKIPAE